jgi:hypothetical protein
LDERDPARCSEGAHLANGARTITTSWNGVVVGRIFCLDAVGPQGRPWMWASGHSAASVKRAARVRTNPRGCDGSVRQELAASMANSYHLTIFLFQDVDRRGSVTEIVTILSKWDKAVEINRLESIHARRSQQSLS